ncbi:membrane-spanning 4-domains subfamily A member 15 [Zootoca vivipara]|uniref:membrane-spanning 4-domains subfamily A member 15 n=1 Tax=Zootoca vivipara TaxID=8524 RepID=UPI001592A7DB|nr:membrane-spanning 4-domains subfamily A member 15 [Zootoca vivipara]
MSTTVTECGNVRIISKVVQPGQQEAGTANTSGTTVTVSHGAPTYSKTTKNMLPKALGTVQIVVGAIEICFGVALTAAQEDSKTLTVKSGVYFWFGILLLVSGSLLVEMEKRDLQWLVKACSAANLLVCVAALVAVILHSTEIAQTHQQGDLCHDSDMRYGYCSNSIQTLIYGLNAVFIIFSVLELSIAVAALVVGFRSSQQQLYRQMAL